MTTIDRPSRALTWAEQTFGPIALDPHERVMRFLEEAIELGHAIGVSGSDLQNLVGRIWSRKRGDVARELGTSGEGLGGSVAIWTVISRFLDIHREELQELAREFVEEN